MLAREATKADIQAVRDRLREAKEQRQLDTLEDTNGNRKLLKKRYEQKIDAVAAMMDAYIAYKLNRDAFE